MLLLYWASFVLKILYEFVITKFHPTKKRMFYTVTILERTKVFYAAIMPCFFRKNEKNAEKHDRWESPAETLSGCIDQLMCAAASLLLKVVTRIYFDVAIARQLRARGRRNGAIRRVAAIHHEVAESAGASAAHCGGGWAVVDCENDVEAGVY